MNEVPTGRVRRLAMLLALGALIAIGAMWLTRQDRERLSRYPQVSSLRQIGAALNQYADAHGGRFPERLDVLVDARLIDRRTLEEVSVAFPAAGRARAALEPHDVVAYTHESDGEAGEIRHTLNAAGHVEAGN